MSGFLVIAGPDEGRLADADVERMVAALGRRGDRVETRREPGVTVAVTRFDWELADGFSGPALVVRDGGIIVTSDATLYYREELARRLRAEGVRPAGDTTAHLIAAAYRAWGADCPRYLEGDYAFVIHDGTRHRTVAARDFMGRRPLYHARIGESLVLASAVSAIIAHPACPRDLDELALGEVIGYSLAGHDRTPYSAVRALPRATTLVGDADGTVRTSEFWTLQLEDGSDARSFDDAAEHLTGLLEAAILERRSPAGPTAIWLSGGYDSSVLYGVGNAALDRRGLHRLHPISYSHPPGDPGREDELIAEITKFWDTAPTWLSIDDVPLLADVAAHAASADIPFQHAFENWLRALFTATRASGARVALNGDGGDQLFAVSTVFLHDLFASFRWRALRREWQSLGWGGVRALWWSVARPVLADWARTARGVRRPELPLPPWLEPQFVHRHQLEARQMRAEAELAAAGGGRAGTETRRSLTNPTTPRVLAGMSALALEYGVELRVPLFDRRIVEFALRRPHTERASAGAVKHLLRRSARDLLPASVLAPRKERTGVLSGYFTHSFRADPGGVVSDAFAAPMLADLGIVNAAAMQQAWRDFRAGRGGRGVYLFAAFQAELWLRSRDPTPAAARSSLEWIRAPAAGIVQ